MSPPPPPESAAALATVSAVVGGGPAGLAAAYRLTRAPAPGAGAPPPVLLLGHAPALGGLAAGLRSRAVVLCYVALRTPAVGRADTYYFPERRFPFNRVTEQKRFSPATAPPDRAVLCLDLACEPDDATFAASDDDLRALVLPALREAGLLGGAPVEGVFSRRFRHAYPVYDLATAALRRVTDWLARFANLWAVGGQGLFLHNNTDHSLLIGYRAAGAIAAGGDRRAWAADLEAFATFRVADRPRPHPAATSVLSPPPSSRARRSSPLRRRPTPSARRRPATSRRRRGSPRR